MISVPAYDQKGKLIDPIEIDEALLGGEVKVDLLREAVAIYEARQRVGSRRTLGRGDVAGSTRKMYRQKGTGMARMGNRQVVHHRGGGMAFAIRDRRVSRDLPRKARRAALKSALLGRLIDGEVAVFAPPELEAPKTRAMVEALGRINSEGVSALVVIGNGDTVLYKSTRNLAAVDVCRVGDLNAHCVLKPHRVLFTRQAMDAFLEGLS